MPSTTFERCPKCGRVREAGDDCRRCGRSATEIAESRPPDRVTFSEWEPVYGPDRTRQLATRVVGAFFLTVTEWTEVKDQPIVGHRRRRYESWQPEAVARWEWEYR